MQSLRNVIVRALGLNNDADHFLQLQTKANEVKDHKVSRKLARDIATWNGNLALLRGDNIYDVARLYFSSKGQHSLQTELRVEIEHGETQEESARKVSQVVEEKILNPIGLRMIRTVMGRIICSNTTIVGAFVNPGSTATKATYDVLGYPEFCNWFEARFKDELVGEPTPTLKRLRIDGQGNITMATETIPAVTPIADIMKFYPYLDKSPEEMITDFMKSKSNVLLLLGPPGTGKSTYVLHMLRELGFGDKIHLADRDDVLSHPNFPDTVRDMPSGSVMVTEDSDKMVMKRTEGNATMSALLNATAGIVQRDSKLIIVTNLTSLNAVDEALVRPGRCFKIMKFHNLNAIEANALRVSTGLGEADFGSRKDISMAEALNLEEIAGETRHKMAIGFSNN